MSRADTLRAPAVGVEIRKRTVLINAASAIAARVLRMTVLVWMFQHLLRRISPEQFAVYALVTAMIVFAPLFTSFFASGVNRYVVEACARGDHRRASQIVSSIFPVLFAAALAFTVLGCLFAWHIDGFLNIEPHLLADARLMMMLLVGDFALQMAITCFGTGFAVRQRFLLANVIDIAVELFRMCLLFALLFGLGPRVLWVVVATVTANLVSAAVKTAVSARLVPGLRLQLSAFHWPTTRELVSFGWWTSVNQLAGVIHITGDIVILNKLASGMDVAVFKLGAEFYLQLEALVIGAALVPMKPVLTSLHALGARDRLQESVLRSARYILWFSLIAAIPLVVYRKALIVLYAGEPYLAAADVLALLLGLFLFMPAGFLLAPISEAMARMRPFSLANFLIQMTKLSVTLYVVGRLGLGAVGCAMSTLAVVGAAHVFVLAPMTLRMAGIAWRRYPLEVLAKGVPPALAGALVWSVLAVWMQPASWLSLGACFAVGALAYIGALVRFALNAEERRDLRSLLEKIRPSALSAQTKLVTERPNGLRS